MFVTALVELEPTAALRVPASAVFLFGDRRYVFVEEAPGRYRNQAVDAGDVSTVDAYRGVNIKPVAKQLTDLIKLSPEDWRLTVRNDFEDSVFPKFPKIAGIKSAWLYSAGAVYAFNEWKRSFGLWNT